MQEADNWFRRSEFGIQLQEIWWPISASSWAVTTNKGHVLRGTKCACSLTASVNTVFLLFWFQSVACMTAWLTSSSECFVGHKARLQLPQSFHIDATQNKRLSFVSHLYHMCNNMQVRLHLLPFCSPGSISLGSYGAYMASGQGGWAAGPVPLSLDDTKAFGQCHCSILAHFLLQLHAGRRLLCQLTPS